MVKFGLFPFGSCYILPAQLDDKAMTEGNLSAWWESGRMSRAESPLFPSPSEASKSDKLRRFGGSLLADVHLVGNLGHLRPLSQHDARQRQSVAQ